MIVIRNGQYLTEEGTQNLVTSNHPAYQAQVEVSLPRGEWIGAPDAGLNLDKRVKQSERQVEEARKQIGFYLQKYSPDIRDTISERFSGVFPIVIEEDAFNE